MLKLPMRESSHPHSTHEHSSSSSNGHTKYLTIQGEPPPEPLCYCSQQGKWRAQINGTMPSVSVLAHFVKGRLNPAWIFWKQRRELAISDLGLCLLTRIYSYLPDPACKSPQPSCNNMEPVSSLSGLLRSRGLVD